MTARPWQSYHTVFTNEKAGMGGVDKEKVQKVVYEMSKGSRYFENEQRKAAAMQQRVQHMHSRVALLTAVDIANFEKIADGRLAELEAMRDLSRTWMHVDLDAFYASVEILEDPSLAGKPMAVGGQSMICTANYEARRFGIRAAMPGFIARRLCPHLIFVPPNFDRYAHYSEKVRQVFREYDAHFMSRSLDEAYLDITVQCSLRGMSAKEVAEELRQHVHEKTGLTCSAGVGPNRLIAKVCSDMNKPNGQFVLPNEREAIMKFISGFSTRKVSGIGKATEHLLREILGVTTCEDLIKKRALIFALFSRTTADFFLSVGLGIGGSDSHQEEPRKSLSSERTFSSTSNEDDLFNKLEEIVQALSRDMEVEGLHGCTLTLKLKTTDFEVKTRSLTLPFSIHLKEDMMFHASKLLKAELPLSLRLIGLRISQFRTELRNSTQRRLLDYSFSCGADSGKLAKSISDGDSEKCFLEVKAEETFNCMPQGQPQSGCLENTFETTENQESYLGSSCQLSQQKCLFVDCLKTKSVENDQKTSTSNRDCKRGQIEHLFRKNGFESMGNSNILWKNDIPLSSIVFNKQQDFPMHQTCRHNSAEGISEHDLKSEQTVGVMGIDLESRFSSAMTWLDERFCSLCGLEIPACCVNERQEHADFHFAQVLQQEYCTGSACSTLELLKEPQQKRLCRSSTRAGLQQRGRSSMAADFKRKGKHVQIDSFFQRK